MSARVLALDTATRTGWAFARDRERPDYGVIAFAKTGDDIGSFLCEADDRFGAMVDELKPTLIMFESPILPKTTTITIVRKLCGLTGVVEMIAHRKKIAVEEAAVWDIRRHFIGESRNLRGKDAKQAVVLECCRRGWRVVDNNIADALAILDFARARLFPKDWGLKATPLFGVEQ